MPKKKLEKLSEKEVRELDSHINFLLASIEPITKQLVEPRFCLTFGKKRFTRGYVYKFGKNKQVYKTNEKAKDIKTFEDIKNQILSSKYYKEFKKVNIGLHSWNKNAAGESLVFLDIDNKNLLEGKAELFKQEIENQGIKSLVQKSPSGGNHILLFVKSEKELKNVYGIVPNVDLICRPQSYVIAAGGTTEKGTYSLSSISNIQTIDLNEIPKLVSNAATSLNLQDIKSSEEILNNWINCEKQEGENPKHLKEKVFKTLPENLKKRFNLAFEKKEVIHKGQRMHFLRHHASRFLASNKKVNKTAFFRFCSDLNNEFLQPRLEFEEIKEFAFSYQKEFYSKVKKFSLTTSSELESIKLSLIQKLSLLPKEIENENFTQSKIVLSHLKALFQKLSNKTFKKSIPDKVIPQILKAAGFTSSQSRKSISRGLRFWNISTSSLSSLSSLSSPPSLSSSLMYVVPSQPIDITEESQNWKPSSLSSTDKSNSSIAMKPTSQPIEFQEESQNSQEPTSVVELKLDNTTHSNDQFKNPSQNIILKTQESNQDIQMTIHTQEQKECPAESPSESEIPSDQARLQEIELELTTITNSKELSLKEKKELYSTVALKINSKDLSKISKNLLNFIPSEDYRKICKR